jgi:hypothetical protein
VAIAEVVDVARHFRLFPAVARLQFRSF